jgi:Cof subfamily protein (haloacid dehalogenase superfamily)
MTYRLLVADIDGTLVNARRELTPPVREAVREAQARGIRVCLATGRNRPSAQPYVDGLGADPPVILYNGGMVYDFARDDVWLRMPLPAEQAAEVLRIVRRYPDVQPHLYVDDCVYVSVMNDITRTYERKDGVSAEVVGDLGKWLSADPMKILIIGARAPLKAVARDIDRLPHAVNHVFSQEDYLEVLPPGVNKGTALRAMAERLGIRREHIVAAGDNLNDLAMIRYAGLGVAMGGAPDGLRAAAAFVAPSSDEHGLRDVIERFILSPDAGSMGIPAKGGWAAPDANER